jgi:hypothetical protein
MLHIVCLLHLLSPLEPPRAPSPADIKIDLAPLKAPLDKAAAQLEKLCRQFGLHVEIAPLESLLLALPPKISAELRELMAERLDHGRPLEPSRNGDGA